MSSPGPTAAPLAPLPRGTNPDAVLDRFLAVAAERGLTLYPEQEEAILELFAGRNVILNTPTGSGKSLVAAALHYQALCAGERSVYTCPIKALVNEKFLSLCRDFGPENVGMMTGDASVNPRAPVLCCTAEILANMALHRGEQSDVRAVIMDEFHYYSDAERGSAWQVPLLTLPRARFLLMSATLGSTDVFERELTELTGEVTVTVRSDRRPVPLEFEYSEVPLAERVSELLTLKRAPIYLVYFTQRSASEAAQNFMSLNVSSKEEKAALQTELERVKFNSPYGKELRRFLRHGIGVHHAGLLPKYRILVEQLAQKGLLKLICGTDTLGVGINVPIRTVVFTQLWKYDGTKAAILSVRDFRQISGRAGRKGYDDKGYVIIQAPEHVIENKRLEAKAAADPRKKKVAKVRAPEGAVGWDEKTAERLKTAPPEELSSHFEVSHGMLLLVLSREDDGCRAMQRLIRASHETPFKKRALRKRAWQLFRALLERKIVEFIPPQPSGRKLRVNVELQDDFSLHQALSLYLIDTLPLLQGATPRASASAADTAAAGRAAASAPPLPAERDAKAEGAARVPATGDGAEPELASASLPSATAGADIGAAATTAATGDAERSEPASVAASPADAGGGARSEYALDVLTLCEAIVEDPDAILRQQLNKLKSEKLEEMRAAGIEYEERMEKLEQVEYPKPKREFLYDTFNAFAAAHPWVDQENVRPKSIAREMYERYLSFADYVREYGLQRSEGLLLRHLSQVWKVLAQTVPATAKTEEVIELEEYFRELIRGIDSSLLEEWERLRDPNFSAAEAAEKPDRPSTYDVTRDRAGFRRLVRTAVLGFLQDVAARDFESASSRLLTGMPHGSDDNAPLSADAKRIEAGFRAYFDAHTRFRLDPEGRSAQHTHWEEEGDVWRIAQVLVDPEADNDWEVRFELSLADSRRQNRPSIRFESVAPIGAA